LLQYCPVGISIRNNPIITNSIHSVQEGFLS
jgi:hypothetical protein